jgi:hypothetical protein
LREDDFLYVKLGNAKPVCEPIVYAEPTSEQKQRAAEIAQTVAREFGPALNASDSEPLFQFIRDLSAPVPATERTPGKTNLFSPRYCYSYFALYGDPLLHPELDPYPDAYLSRLASSGVDGVWLQGLLEKLASSPWEAGDGKQAERLKNLSALVARARKHGMGVYLYLNEPRSKPIAFFASHPELKGVTEGEHAALCTSVPAVRDYLRKAVAEICAAAPDLAGLFTISGSENLSNCWSHHNGAGCPLCSKRSPAEVIAEANNTLASGIKAAGAKTRFIAWDWGWQDGWAQSIIQQLDPSISLMSVSEWGMPIQRGGIKASIGEYSLSTIGPGARATQRWEWARQRGLRTFAKVQLGNTWELSATPYNPAMLNVAEHAANLRSANVSGLMLGWTLGGYPSPNLEIVAAISQDKSLSPEGALNLVAEKRFGKKAAADAVEAWKKFSLSFREFPFDGGLVYNAPMQYGPSNLLWEQPTGYHATMIGFPYDDLDGWRGVYPPEIFVRQFEKVAAGYQEGVNILKDTFAKHAPELSKIERTALAGELSVASAAFIHFDSTASQARFVMARRAGNAKKMLAEIGRERKLARELWSLQKHDSRLGFEASNQYYYVGNDLIEKMLNCDYLARKLEAQEAAK